MDDLLVFSNDQGLLVDLAKRIAEFLQGERLHAKANKTVIARVQGGVPFLGFRVFARHRMLKASSVARVRRRMKEYRHAYAMRCLPPAELGERIRAVFAHLSWARTTSLRRALGARTRFVKRSPRPDAVR